MKNIPWKAARCVAILCCGLSPLTAWSQQAATGATPLSSSAPNGPDIGPGGPAVLTATPSPERSAAAPLNADAVMKEIEEMKAHFTQAEAACFAAGNGTAANASALWWPGLRTNQTVNTLAIVVRF